jgi:AbrB family looped-hinge helix DNA binding protein
LITTLSTNGRVTIPKPLRDALLWEPGQHLEVIGVDGGILLRPVHPFATSTLEQVTACLRYPGSPKTLIEMEEAIQQGAKKHCGGGG